MKNDDSFEKFMSGESIFGKEYDKNKVYVENTEIKSESETDYAGIADEYAKMFGQHEQETEPSQSYQSTDPHNYGGESFSPLYGNKGAEDGGISTSKGILPPQTYTTPDNSAGLLTVYKGGSAVGWLLAIIGIILIAVGLLFFKLSADTAKQTREFFENAEECGGIILDTKSETTTDDDTTTTIYNVYVEYNYNNQIYRGWSENLAESEYNRLGVTQNKQNYVSIYVDKRNPLRMRVLYEPDAKPAYIILVMVFVGLVVFIMGINVVLKYFRLRSEVKRRDYRDA